MTKIDLLDTAGEAIVKLARGNPGAVTALIELQTKTGQIDKESVYDRSHLSKHWGILTLDELEIYGPRIWMLYSDVCKKNIRHMVGLLRAFTLELIDAPTLNHAIDNYGEGLDITYIMAKLKKKLPTFRIED